MTEKANKRHSGLGKIFDRIFRGRSNSLPSTSSSSVDAVRKGEAAKKKKNKKDKNTVVPAENDFGVVETERLTHFQKPKPPANRRRPRGVPSSTSSLRVTTIREEDEASDELCQPPEIEEKNLNVIVVEDKVTEAPRLFTPALPPPGLREKLRFQKDRQILEEEEISSTKVQRDEDDEDRQSASIETIDESETEMRQKKESCSSNSDKSSNKSSVNLSRSLSGKIDLEQIRTKSKNLRLVKSLEVGGKCVSENGKPLIRSSDPGRQ